MLVPIPLAQKDLPHRLQEIKAPVLTRWRIQDPAA